ncbi:MAG: ethanolamine ammonia-lyase subunit EutB [Bryobacterales bacterium]|nr:ethanolamine ammonia-lyase subunit EutB [Bryobacterales bacterium]
MHRRQLLLGTAAAVAASRPASAAAEDIPGYLQSHGQRHGGFDLTRYRQLLGAANEFKEGDAAAGVAAKDEAARITARTVLAQTRLSWLAAHSVYEDSISLYIQRAVDGTAWRAIANWTVGELKDFLLTRSETEIARILPGLPSDIIACTVKLMTNAELIAASRKIFHPLPGSNIGARGYLSARIQPNSPTDDPEDIQWQVFNGWAYGVGDLVLGTNPVSSDVDSVIAVEKALQHILKTFQLEDVLPHCVLAHIDVQADAERRNPGSTAFWFQSLAGVADAATTFDISVEKMVRHAAARTGRYGLYFETGQGADGANGHGKGFDIVIHESRKYGLARALKQEVAAAQRKAGRTPAPWLHVNDVAGFIGPEVFRTREQLVRCCLEDTLMGKMHGLTHGLDICSTLHMEVSLDDLDWCIDQVMPANPAYLMALPTKNDPMLSYLTTAFQDHVRIREKFGYKVNDAMWAFFQKVEVVDAAGRPAKNFGRPERIYLAYRRRLGDARAESEILAEAGRKLNQVRSHNVDIATSHGAHIWDLEPQLDRKVRSLYADAKKCIWAELPAGFDHTVGPALALHTLSANREDYVLHPATGEQLAPQSLATLTSLAGKRKSAYDAQIVVSDGLNAYSLTDPGHLPPYLTNVRSALEKAGYRVAPEILVIRNARVRAGYRIGEILFGGLSERESRRAIVHVIGERPGTSHRAYSVYLTALPVSAWSEKGHVDHNVTRVISGISDTSLDPVQAAAETVRLLGPAASTH